MKKDIDTIIKNLKSSIDAESFKFSVEEATDIYEAIVELRDSERSLFDWKLRNDSLSFNFRCALTNLLNAHKKEINSDY